MVSALYACVDPRMQVRSLTCRPSFPPNKMLYARDCASSSSLTVCTSEGTWRSQRRFVSWHKTGCDSQCEDTWQLMIGVTQAEIVYPLWVTLHLLGGFGVSPWVAGTATPAGDGRGQPRVDVLVCIVELCILRTETDPVHAQRSGIAALVKVQREQCLHVLYSQRPTGCTNTRPCTH